MSNKTYNKLLQRQLSKYINSNIILNNESRAFLDAINETYDHYEKDRLMIERSMEISSHELTEANKKLRNESEENNLALKKLQESLKFLKQDYNGHYNSDNNELNLLELANIIRIETEHRKKVELQLKQNLKYLEKTNKELDQFAYVVSHDLKAPLRAIASLADWIKEDSNEELTQESKTNLDLLRGRVTRMESLIHGILTYSKIGKTKTENTLVSVNSMINDIVDLLNPSSNIKIKMPTEVLLLSTEATKLQQIFSNLISNSIKYMDKKDGEITIGWHKNKENYEFYVEDNGPGIEEEYHQKVFVIFQTLSARDHIESTGIGLSIVKKIIEEQGGKIWIESTKNCGSKFIFTWAANININNKNIA